MGAPIPRHASKKRLTFKELTRTLQSQTTEIILNFSFENKAPRETKLIAELCISFRDKDVSTAENVFFKLAKVVSTKQSQAFIQGFQLESVSLAELEF